MRVLLIFRPDERSYAEMVADHLARLGMEVVLDLAASAGETPVKAAFRELGKADRVLVIWDDYVTPNGSMASLSRAAAQQGKLVLLVLDDADPTYTEGADIVDLGEWDGDPLSPELATLVATLRAPIKPVEELGQSGELGQGPIRTHGDQGVLPPPPAPPYQIQTERPPITSRLKMRGLSRELDDVRSQLAGAQQVNAGLLQQVEKLRSQIPPSKGTLFPRILAAAKTDRAELRLGVYSPVAVLPVQPFLLQVWLSTRAQDQIAKRLARQADPGAKTRGDRRLGVSANRGAELTVTLEQRGLSCPHPVQRIAWEGQPTAAQFVVTAPDVALRTEYFPIVRVFLDGVPIARHVVRVTSAPGHKVSTKKLKNAQAKGYRSAFLSYTSSDRVKVLGHAQAMSAVGVDVFQDVLELEPGARWERQLYRKISEVDLFLVFWSDAAAKSEWVRKETEFALHCQRTRKRLVPEIVPVLLEGPPPAAPPPSLQEINFNDPIRCVIASFEKSQSP